jgi:hypothetical protein
LELARAIERIPLLGDRAAKAQQRMTAVWENREPDSLPLLIPGRVPPELTQDLPRFNLQEAYYDPEKMLFNSIPGLLASALSPGDSIPSIRADMGCGIFPTLLGAVNSVFEDIRPWITEHVSKEKLSRMTPDDIDVYSGDFGRGLEYMAFFKKALAGRAYVFTMDVQGPIDTAHQVMGDQFFYELYDDPPFVHHLLALCTEAIIRGIKACKEVNGESLDTAFHYNCLWAARGGVKTSEDTSTLLSEEHIAEYCVPYTQRLLAEFGGGWIHYCGSNPYLYQAALQIPECSGLNFGNPERFDAAQVLADCRRADKVYYGVLHVPGNLPPGAYFQRIWQALDGKKLSLVLQVNGGKDPEATVAAWRVVQQSPPAQ